MTPNPDLTTGLDTALRSAAEQLRRAVAELDREVEGGDPDPLAATAFEPWRLQHMQSVIAAALFLEEASGAAGSVRCGERTAEPAAGELDIARNIAEEAS